MRKSNILKHVLKLKILCVYKIIVLYFVENQSYLDLKIDKYYKININIWLLPSCNIFHIDKIHKIKLTIYYFCMAKKIYLENNTV